MNFKELVGILFEYNSDNLINLNYHFRGQADSSWLLEPSFKRIIKNRDINRAEVINLENNSVIKFSSTANRHFPDYQVNPLMEKNGSPQKWPWIMHMQHYSVPTRLLDWTESYWIALYFACNESYDTDGKLFIVDKNRAIEYADKICTGKDFLHLADIPESKSVLNFISPRIKNDRISIQFGCFTLCTDPLIDHCLMLNVSKSLREIIIPKKIKPIIMKELRKMGITGESIYLCADGLGKTIKEFIEYAHPIKEK